MDIRKKITLLLTLLLAEVFIPALTWAGGLYLYEVAPAEVGLASAGIAARAQDASTLFTNPAGMTRLKQPEVLFGLQPIYAHLDFESNSNTSDSNRFQPDGDRADSGDASAWIPAGSTFIVYPVNKDLKIGFGVLGFFGSAIEYNDDWEGRYYAKDIRMQGFSFMPSVAYRVNDWLSLGAGLNAMYGILEMEVAVNNGLAFPDGQLEIEDKVWGFGGLFGVLIEPTQHARFGLTYMTKTKLDFEVETDFSDLRPAFETILRNNGLFNAKIDMPINAPQAVMLSGYHEINNQWAIMGNVGWQDWSDFGNLEVSVSAEDTNDLTVDLQYDDTWHAAAGVQYRPSEPLVLSLGIAYDSAMMGEDERSPSMPVGEAWRFGTGMQYKVRKNIDISLAYEFLWGGDMAMDVNRGPLAGRVSGDYNDTYMHFINLAFNWKF